ncbi:MAG: PD-(D/E)XK nuclease family protein [Tannerella sp.]|nr:PD-(D/E)XK nuclease family protein [Tannerella sp.]
MTPFLKQIARLFYDQYGADIHRRAFVFPNRRSGIFFRKYLVEVAGKPIFSPSVMTINDLFCRLSPKRQVDRIKLLFLLYDVYIRQSGSDETFDDFVYWGEMLLNDFDDVDKYLVDAKQLFTNVKDLNDIEKEFSFLQPAQIQAIRSFWSSFRPESDKAGKQSFLRVWELLYPIYAELRDILAAEGLAYEGMIYREVIENFDGGIRRPPAEEVAGDLSGRQHNSREVLHKLHFEKIIFVGLNALTKAERELLKRLKQEGVADFYWDYASGKLKDEDNRASFFMEENLRMFPSASALPEEEAVQTRFEIIGIPSRIGQAKQLYPILKELSGDKTMSAEEALQTAIVLPDEQLLIPVLNSIPENTSRINVTLGYPLAGTPVASLMNDLQSLQRNIRKTTEDIRFYHRDVIAVLRHKYVSSVCPEEAALLIKEITERNQVYIPVTSLGLTPLLKLLFAAPASITDISDYLTAALKEMNRILSSEAGEATEAEAEAEATVSSTALEQEFIFHYYTTVNRMHEMIRKTKTEMSSDTYFRLLKQMTDFIKIPFHGEPLSGLQVMGVLETRVLDFDNLIILSMNEGIFPAKSAADSLIPYHLRKGFGLPVQEHKESIRAYHFYRMIQRARRVIMLYDTRTDGLQSGEVSRFVHQLIYHYKISVQQKLAVYTISSSHVEPFHVGKNDEIIHALAAYETEKSLSASAINIYLDCPLKFYLSVVKGMDEEEAVSETLENDTFGTILHRVMELIYKPFCGKVITADLIQLAAQDKNMTGRIREAFAKDFFHTEEPRPLAGQAYLYGETIRKYACALLAYDRSLTPFTYVNSEKLIHSPFEIAGGRRIRLKGFIDRIDQTGETIRIIDYKSGRPVALTFDRMESLFDKTAKERRKAIMQVFLYAWLYAPEAGGKPIQPAVYYARNLFKQTNFDPAIRQVDGKAKTLINNFDDYRDAFENHLRSCLNELFDPAIPFMQTQNTKVCEYCPFTGICDR